MTGEQIMCLRDDVNRVGHLLIDQDGEMIIEAVELGTKSREEALKVIVRSWNDLRALFDEVSSLAEDHARMTHALQKINEKVVDAMQGTARSEIAVDWWQAVNE
ncbi:MAG: hypothetical protein IKJ11_11045 [Clostridia bacterium]|nr:hypothetical protein [Clostridia bacterium]